MSFYCVCDEFFSRGDFILIKSVYFMGRDACAGILLFSSPVSPRTKERRPSGGGLHTCANYLVFRVTQTWVGVQTPSGVILGKLLNLLGPLLSS